MSRTVSMSRTWTSRQPTIPDWLLGARRAPADLVTREASTAGTLSGVDVERGAGEGASKDITHPEAAHYVHAQDADVLVIPQSELDRTGVAHLGVASMLEDPAEAPPAESNLRRRLAPSEDVSRTPPSETTVDVSDRFIDACTC